ncbi:MAG: RagB/SusD family nutrient uptake outer membrane protein [Lutibacter sp.]
MRIKSIFVVGILLLVFSCKNNEHKVLKKEEPLKKLTAIDALTMVSDIYDTYQNSEEYLIKGIFYPANFLSQDFNLWGKEGNNYKTFNVTANNKDINAFWELSYTGIKKANRTIISLSKMVSNQIISKELANRLKAECYFNRGVLYYYLACNFGNVPILKNTDTTLVKTPKSSQQQVFSYIVKDLEKAKKNLPFVYKEKKDLGRATKGATIAYLGEAYMWIGEYKKAIEEFDKLSTHYKLISNFIDVHSFKHQNNKESIFEIQFNGNDNLGWGRDNYSTFIQSFALPTEVGGAGLAYINKKCFKSFNKRDKRRRATIIGPNEKHPDTSINISSYNHVQEHFKSINTLGTYKKPWLGEDKTRSGYYSVKTWRAPDPEASASAVFSKANVILLRYGQVILDKAFCEIKIGEPDEGLKLINQIRKRAGLQAIKSTSNLMPKLLNEYRHELVGEYSLWYALRRSGAYKSYLKNNFNISISDGHEILPIPSDQLRINKALKQNLGY